MGKIFKLKETLYHGTSTFRAFDSIDLCAGNGYHDFGKGFYMAYTKSHSINRAKNVARKDKLFVERHKIAVRNPIKGILYTYRANPEALKSLKVKVFETADLNWVKLVIACRESDDTPHDYDIVVGPTADDDTILCFNMYNEGVYGDKESIKAMSVLLNNLEVYNLGTQVFIGTEKGLSILDQGSRKEEIV